MNARAVTALLVSILITTACSRSVSEADPSGLRAGMTTSQTTEILGAPNTIKPAGKSREIYIYRKQSEFIHVFFIKGRIKSIEHVRRKPHHQG